jgi:hypothetical protein
MTQKIDNGGQAFPLIEYCHDNPGSIAEIHHGMSLRDYFAAAALPAIISGLMLRWQEPGYSDISALIEASRLAYDAADAILHISKGT